MVGMLRVLSDLASRAGFASKAGITFGGQRDLYDAFGYKRNLEFKDFQDRYDRGDMASRIVDVFPEDTWKGEPEVWEDEDPEVWTQFEQLVYDFAEKHQLWPTLMQLDKLSGVGRYGVLYIGAPGAPDTPLTSLKLDDVQYILPLSEGSAKIDTSTVVTDTTSPRYGQPMFYQLQVSQVTNVKLLRVHYTRCIHVISEPLESLTYGRPRLQRVWNRLDDLDKVAGGGAEAFFQRAHRGYQFDISPDVKVTEDDKQAMTDAIDEFTHNLRRTLRTRGVTTTEFGSDVANFKDPIESIVSIISGATGIPQRKLLGSERGELASTTDKTNWDDLISSRQHSIAHPRFVKPLIDLFINLGALPQPAEYVTKWPEREEMTPKEQVDMADKAAGINRKAGELVITGDEIREHYLGFDPLSQAQKDAYILPEQGTDDPGADNRTDGEDNADNADAAA